MQASIDLFPGKTITAAFTGDQFPLNGGIATFQFTVIGTSGAQTATVLVEYSNGNGNWATLSTVSLSGTTSASDGFAISAPYSYIRASLTAISGTGAKIYGRMSQ
jgi:hypothetical protein